MFPQQAPISISSTQPASKKPLPKSPLAKTSWLKYLLMTVATLYLAVSLYFMYYTYSMYELRPKIFELEAKQKALESQQADLSKRVHTRLSEFKQTMSTTLTDQVGTTRQQLDARTAELEREQKAATAKLAAAQTQQSKQLAAVTGEITNVKSDVGSAKADIQKTEVDIAATNAKLDRAMGDLGIQSGLIAHNASELAELKRKGERSYWDFTLNKGARQPISTVSLVLKKVDPKKSTFTLVVLADDRNIEKKDRTLGEPLQFYTGRDHQLYELVVFAAQKNSITGYISTPKYTPVVAKQ